MPLCIALLWPLMRPYDGLNRDGQLYVLQAMAHVFPGRFSNDLFFLYGSQDSFTIVTRIAAPVYAWLGLDHASALLVVVGGLAWWSACWLLARSVAGPRIAWLSLIVVMAAPGWYGGGGEIFRYAETYFGARLFAEAVVLLALALGQFHRPYACFAALAAAFLIHPLMTLPGLGVFVLTQVDPRRWAWLLVAAAILVLAAVGVALLAPVGRLQIVDSAWLDILRSRNSALFPTTWSLSDWQRAAIVACLLLTSWMLMPEARTSRLALATAVVGIFGVVSAWLIGEFAPVELLLQMQPWRVLWLASVVAYLLTPLAVISGWKADPYARASSILLVTAVCALNQGAALTSAAAALALAALPNRAAIPQGRLVVAGALLAATLTVVFSLMSAAAVARIPAWGEQASASFEQLRNVFGLVVPGVAIVLGLLLLLRDRATAPRIAAAVIVLTALAVASGMPAWREFKSRPYTGAQYQLFAGWRAQIPPGANVFWPGSPVFVWFLLERPSYISVSQLAGVIFSREISLEGLDRIRSLGSLADEGAILRRPGATDEEFRPLTLERLVGACQDERLGFVVSPVDLSLGAPVLAWPDKTRRIYLYDCRTIRTA